MKGAKQVSWLCPVSDQKNKKGRKKAGKNKVEFEVKINILLKQKNLILGHF